MFKNTIFVSLAVISFVMPLSAAGDPVIIQVDGTDTAIYSATINISVPLEKTGDGTLILTATNTMDHLKIAAGMVSINSINNIGGESSSVTVTGVGTLKATGDIVVPRITKTDTAIAKLSPSPECVLTITELDGAGSTVINGDGIVKFQSSIPEGDYIISKGTLIPSAIVTSTTGTITVDSGATLDCSVNNVSDGHLPSGALTVRGTIILPNGVFDKEIDFG